MRSRSAAAFCALVLATASAWASAPTASAVTVSTGHCSTKTGVTLVVDHQALGGGTIIKCVEGLPAGSSGLELLDAAGLSREGTQHDGSSFVCRVGGRPAANETFALQSGEEYRETCINTPPEDAFWGYWHATNGGNWTFSSWGAGNREVIPGGYEGFSFSLNNSTGSNPPPGVKPSHPVVTPTPTPTATPTPTVAVQPAKPTASASAEQPVKPKASAGASAPAEPTVEPSATPTPSSTPGSTPQSPSPEPEPTTASPSTPPVTTQATTSEAPEPSAAPVPAVVEDDGPPVGTFIGLGAVAALGL
ncbi:MAG: hypothetical protein Q4G35_07435, partial [Propionibacteriaceae bacterium]|nr:hypothetical protein [Propionibacteriaceae bacterium]